MNRYNAVLLDFDGTVMDTNRMIMNSWQYTYKQVTGRPGDEAFIYSTYGEILYDSMKKAFPNEDTDRCVAYYRGYQRDHFLEEIRLFPGMKEAIAGIKARGRKTALVTSRMRKTTMQGVEAFGLDGLLDTVVAVEDTEEHKPEPAPILKALERLEVQPEESLMVGDSQYDLLCAERAGVDYAMVSWTAAGDALRRLGKTPDYTVQEAADLLKII